MPRATNCSHYRLGDTFLGAREAKGKLLANGFPPRQRKLAECIAREKSIRVSFDCSEGFPQPPGTDRSVARLGKRTADFRRGRRLGPGDHVVEWLKPRKPRTIGQAAYDALPESLTVREARVRIDRPGFRTTSLVIATTLLDANAFTAGDLAELDRARWNAELDLRSPKRTLQMDVLRGKTPEVVRKEVWAHVLADNLVRTVTTRAAARHDLKPRRSVAQTATSLRPIPATSDGRSVPDSHPNKPVNSRTALQVFKEGRLWSGHSCWCSARDTFRRCLGALCIVAVQIAAGGAGMRPSR